MLTDAFVSLILKLNEKRMRPLFFKVKEFVLDDQTPQTSFISKRVTVSFMRKAYNKTQINIHTVFGIRIRGGNRRN